MVITLSMCNCICKTGLWPSWRAPPAREQSPLEGGLWNVWPLPKVRSRLKKPTSVATNIEVRAIGTKVEGHHKGLRSVLCSATCTCDGSCWVEKTRAREALESVHRELRR